MVLAISIQWFGKSNEMERFDSVDQGLPAINTEVETNQSNEGIPLPSDSE